MSKTALAEAATRTRFFDTAWYLAENPDVRNDGVNPLLHYVERGAGEGRDPSPGFSTSHYRGSYPDVAAETINPLAHYLAVGRNAGLSPKPSEEHRLAAYETAITARRSVVGVADIDHVHFPLRRRDAASAGLALPPLQLAQRIGAPTLDEFEEIGQGTKRTILRCLPEDFIFKGARVLDFGCGVGRVLRTFAEEARESEFWGCEIDGPSTRWNVENLSPPFRFFQISEIPTIPLESNSFDLVYAISVFAHIHLDWHHWVAEVRRVLKPGGYAFVTFMAQTPHDEMLGVSYWDRGADFGKLVQNPFSDWNDGGGPMAFHHPDWVKTYWGNLFDIEFIALDGLLEYQSICLMRKPALGAPIKTAVPVFERSAKQAFDPDAVGRISEHHDLARAYLDSYGLELDLIQTGPEREAEIAGWIVFRGDVPSTLDLRVDGRLFGSSTRFEAGPEYRDWGHSPRYAFATTADLAGLSAGEHRLETQIHSGSGRTHTISIPLLVR